MQLKLHCRMSLSLYHCPLKVSLSETRRDEAHEGGYFHSSGDEGVFFLHFSNTELLQNAGKLLFKSLRDM